MSQTQSGSFWAQAARGSTSAAARGGRLHGRKTACVARQAILSREMKIIRNSSNFCVVWLEQQFFCVLTVLQMKRF
jgi:hypothetical protein